MFDTHDTVIENPGRPFGRRGISNTNTSSSLMEKEEIHTGYLKCVCAHNLGLIKLPLKEGVFHLSSCVWQCCGVSWRQSHNKLLLPPPSAPITPPPIPHKGVLTCNCGHKLGSMPFPLDPKYFHLKTCRWTCCNESWDNSLGCSSLASSGHPSHLLHHLPLPLPPTPSPPSGAAEAAFEEELQLALALSLSSEYLPHASSAAASSASAASSSSSSFFSSSSAAAAISDVNSKSQQGVGGEDHLCVICLMAEKNVVLLPCRHLCVCSACASGDSSSMLLLCPMCRGEVKDKMQVFG